MKRMHIFIGIALTFGILAIAGTVGVAAVTKTSDRPVWVTADGRIDYGLVPDGAKVPYVCWSGKSITLSGKTIKQKMTQQPKQGTSEYELGLSKSRELSNVPGVVTKDESGGEVFTIDEANPKVQQIMKKYESKETPQCQ